MPLLCCRLASRANYVKRIQHLAVQLYGILSLQRGLTASPVPPRQRVSCCCNCLKLFKLDRMCRTNGTPSLQNMLSLCGFFSKNREILHAAGSDERRGELAGKEAHILENTSDRAEAKCLKQTLKDGTSAAKAQVVVGTFDG